MQRTLLSTLTTAALFLGACDKKEDAARAAPAATAAATGATGATGDKAAEPEAEAPAETAQAPSGDYLQIKVTHAEPKPDDPVLVTFSGLEVVEANFDPKSIEGASAQFAIDFNTVDSTIAKRDAHLKSPDYLETETFAKATVNVSDVKKDGDAYVAKAKVDAHGKQAEWDVKFEVVEATDDSVRIKGVHSFDRTVFAIGKPAAEGDSASDEVEATFEVTLQKA